MAPVLALLQGRKVLVSEFAGKILNNSVNGVRKTGNGFNQWLNAYYGTGVTLTTSAKTLKDGRTITQRLWSSPGGGTEALTTSSDGFLSLVARDRKGKVYSKIISRDSQHLEQLSQYQSKVGDKYLSRPQMTHIDGENIAMFKNGKLIYANKSAVEARYTVDSTRNSINYSRFNDSGCHWNA